MRRKSRNGLTLLVESRIAPIGGLFLGEISRVPHPHETARVRSITLELSYSCQARGHHSRTSETVWKKKYDLATADAMSASFEIPVDADHPVSYDGELLTVVWGLAARLDVVMFADEMLAVPVVVVPEGGFGLYQGPHPTGYIGQGAENRHT